MEKDLISIVIPVYNVERYLKKCINSIVNQSYKNIEIILVDDGSTDNSSEICDEYIKKDDRIKVIHKENGGLSDARNKGIDMAKGKYITFVDSDDYVENLYIEKLYEAICKQNAVVAICAIYKINENEQIISKIGYQENLVKSGKETLKDLYQGHSLENIVAWNKMYDITLFGELRYPFGKLHEDEFTTYKILYTADKVAIIADPLYYYRQSESSIMGRKFNIKRLDVLDAFEERSEFFKERNEIELYDLSLKTMSYSICKNYVKVKLNVEDNEVILKSLIKRYRNNYKKIWKAENIDIKTKIKMLLFYLFPNLYFTMKKKNK